MSSYFLFFRDALVTHLGFLLGVFIGVDVHKTNTYTPLSHRRRDLGISQCTQVAGGREWPGTSSSGIDIISLGH